MGPFSNDPNAGGPYSAGPPQVAPAWSGPGAGAPAWSGPGGQGAPMWAGPNAGPPPPGVVPFVKQPNSKWPALRLISSILKIIAWVEGGLGALSALGAGVTLSQTVGGAAFLLTLFLLVLVTVGFLMTYASSEVIMLFISIEENTRQK